LRSFVYGAVLAAGALVAPAALMPAAASDSEARLKQAAQYFADLEDAEAKAILDDLSAEGVADADVLLGYLYSDPLYEGRDYVVAAAAFGRAAEAGNDEAVFQVAESRFWPMYLDWPLAPAEEEVRPTVKKAYGLLESIAGEKQPPFEGHNAAKWRLAWLCTFGGYDCGKKATDEAVRAAKQIWGDNLRAITNGYGIINIEMSGEADTPENRKMLEVHLSIGYADADPFVAALQSDPVWAGVSVREDCPALDSLLAAGRLLALINRAAKQFAGRLDLRDCYDDGQLAQLKNDLGGFLDLRVRTYGYENSWSRRWCYDNNDWPAIGQCLITTARDHFFACTKLSMPKYFNERFGIEYRDSRRYGICRETVWAAHQKQGGI